MVRKADRLNWLIRNQYMWNTIEIGSSFPKDRVEVSKIRTLAQTMVDQKLYKPQALATLELSVYTLIKQCDKILPKG